MPISFYDAVVPSSLQVLRALDGVLAKAAAFCAEQGRAEADLIDARLAPDMFPLGYQVKSCAVHSVRAIEATGQDDVLAKIEKLAELHGRGILTDEEFSAKKAELLSRL